MAKQYIKPLIRIVEIDMEQSILTASTGTINIDVDDEHTTDDWD